jgi:hypothetical protein
VIAVAVRWYLRYNLSYRDVEELLAERGVEVRSQPVGRGVSTPCTGSSSAGGSVFVDHVGPGTRPAPI